jgi:mono/diheme cytochrome c family protein
MEAVLKTIGIVLATVVACIIVAAAGAVAFVYSGIYDVSASQPDNAIVAWAVHETSDHSVDARMDANHEPRDLDQPQNIQAGGHVFGENCVVCHGGPGLEPTRVTQGLNPQPPNLFRKGRKPNMNEMFQFIKFGVKMTGMPAFGKTLSDDQIWEVGAFLRKAPGMSPEDFATLTGVSEPKTKTAMPAGAAGTAKRAGG